MGAANLDGLRVAILATPGFEQSELLEPKKALDAAGATTKVIPPRTARSAAGAVRNGASG